MLRISPDGGGWSQAVNSTSSNAPAGSTPGSSGSGSATDPQVASDQRQASGQAPTSHDDKVGGLAAALAGLMAGIEAEPKTASTDVSQLGFKGATGTFGDRSWAPNVDPAQAAKALDALPPGEQDKYHQLFRATDSHPAAQAQLGKMLVDGTLSRKDSKGNTLLDNLATIAKGPATDGLNSSQVLTDTLADITDPSTINQGDKGTCGATSVQSELAQREPAEYARLIAGLSTGNGSVSLQDGTQMSSKGDYNASAPSTTVGLLSPAFMKAQAGGGYNVKSDSGNWSDVDIANLEARVFGGHYDAQKVGGGFLGIDAGMSSSDALKNLQKATPDNPVVAAISVPGGGHYVQVVGYDPGKKTVTIRNPWGETDEIPANEFAKQLTSIITPGDGNSLGSLIDNYRMDAQDDAHKVGSAIVNGAKDVGGALSTGAQDVGNALNPTHW